MSGIQVGEETAMKRIFYVCACTKEKGGIYGCSIEERKKGAEVRVLSYFSVEQPMYMAIDGDTLYAALREPEPTQSGVVRFRINEDYTLTKISEVELTHGAVAAHICVHKGKVYCPNYLGGSTILLPDRMAVHLGRGVDPNRQTTSHPHQALITPDEKYLVVNDLGTDEIRIFDLDLTKQLSSARTPNGSGARHGVFSEDGRYYYCVGEMGGDVSVYSYHEGKMIYKSTVSVLPEDFHGCNKSAAVRLHDGKLYVSNRGHDSVCVLKADGENLSRIGFIPTVGRSPREASFVGDFLLCGNEETNDVTGFALRPDGLSDGCICRLPLPNPIGINEYKMCP